MKTKLIILSFLFVFGCSPDKVEPNNENAIVCGTVFSAQTLFTNSTPSVFIGVRYDILLDTPYLGNTKAYFVLNDANNTNLIQQYWTNPPSNYCGDSSTMTFYN